jgi:hypothetical protein
MTSGLTHHTMRTQVAWGAVIGAIVLNLPTLVWGWYASPSTVITGIIALAVLGAVLGGLIGWMIAPNRWDRWWKDHRRRPGRGQTLPPPEDLTP